VAGESTLVLEESNGSLAYCQVYGSVIRGKTAQAGISYRTLHLYEYGTTFTLLRRGPNGVSKFLTSILPLTPLTLSNPVW